jgi:hypothetical protein
LAVQTKEAVDLLVTALNRELSSLITGSLAEQAS